ncbi:ACP phosphodiesterase [Parafilimonas sp.]|uniref:acyl carrier protein phosphodiesterase n=1 Tax=Parafilimonas sp. TaxID=1969739 RepID=UPI0039E517F5
MNYLAHAWLSFHQPEILVGNMISDFVKGKRRFEYNAAIQKGIALHRSIDAFTDEHEATREAKQFFKPAVGLYAGAFVDIVYDHFLARDRHEFKEDGLLQFSQFVYAVLDKNISVLPEKFARLLPYMKSDNWLYNYQTMHGIEQSFAGLARRAKYLTGSSTAFAAFEINHGQLQQCYARFFPEVKRFAYDESSRLNQPK